jgi:hypothetical protein
MTKGANPFSHSIIPLVLVVALLCTQVGLQYFMLNNSNSVMMAEEENEINSRPLLEEIQLLIDFQINRSCKDPFTKCNFPEYLSKIYQNPLSSIFSPPPDFLIL